MRRRVLVASTGAEAAGGASGVLAWILEALRGRHVVDLLTLAEPDLAALDHYFGTSLAEGGIGIVRAGGLPRRHPFRLALLESHLLSRAGRRWAPYYDLTIGVCNEIDVGRPAVQYIHFPWMYLPRHETEYRWFHRIPGVLDLYRRVCRWISGYTITGMKRNLTLVNSEWTAEKVREWYAPIEPRVVPPPVRGPESPVPWEEREDRFVALGRVSGEKRLDLVLDVLERVRRRGHAVGFDLVALGGDPRLAAALDRRIERAGGWARRVSSLSHGELIAFVGRHRYGIHAMVDEHFGMAVAEMVRAGCLTFAHASGGPAEILGHAEELLFHDADDAVEKICAVLADERRTERLRSRLAERADVYSIERFVAEIREIVETWPPTDEPPRA